MTFRPLHRYSVRNEWRSYYDPKNVRRVVEFEFYQDAQDYVLKKLEETTPNSGLEIKIEEVSHNGDSYNKDELAQLDKTDLRELR